VTLASINLGDAHTPATIALSAGLPPSADAEKARSLVDRVLAMVNARLHVEIEKSAEQTAVWAGTGKDPREVLDASRTSPQGSLLASLLVNPGALGASLKSVIPPFLLPVLQTVSQVEVRLWFADQAIVAEGLVGFAGRTPVKQRANPEYSGFSWESPMGLVPRTEGQACLDRLVEEMTDGIQSIAAVAPSGRDDFLESLYQRQLAPLLDCALKHEDTRGEAAAVESMLLLAIANGLDPSQEPSSRPPSFKERILKLGCNRGHRPLCQD